MFVPESSGIALALCVLNMLCWAFWPTLREKCVVPMPAFAFLNMTSQLLTSIVFAATLGSSGVGTDDAAWQFLARALSGHDARVFAVFAGGFLLGHSDHMGSLAMQVIPAGVAYPLYAGITTVFGTCFDAAQVGLGSNPVLVLLGLALVLVGLALLALGQDVGTRRRSQHGEDGILSLQPSGNSASACDRNLTSPEGSPRDALCESSAAQHKQRISARCAMLICALAGLAGGGWSPLSTLGRAASMEENPVRCAYVSALVFAFGQLCAYPSVALLGKGLGGISLHDAFRTLTVRRALFGCLCGVSVNTGYVLYFVASSLISPTITFCLVSCNPLLALGISSLRGQFREAPRIQLLLFACCAVSYGTAIALLAVAK